jgi:phospholipid transport system substrate-binding protein
MRPLSALLRLTALAAALLLSPVARAGEATDLVRARQNKAIAVLKADPKPSPARDTRLAAVLLSFFDFAALSRATLSEEEWKKHPEGEQKEFASLLSRLIQRSLERRLARVTGFAVEYLDEQEQPGGALVRTRATGPDNREEPLRIDYTLRKGDEGWKAVDVATDGNSTVSGYRTQFRRVIEKDGWPALLDRMKKKLAQIDD